MCRWLMQLLMPRIQEGVSLQFYHILIQNFVPIFNEDVYENAVIKDVFS